MIGEKQNLSSLSKLHRFLVFSTLIFILFFSLETRVQGGEGDNYNSQDSGVYFDAEPVMQDYGLGGPELSYGTDDAVLENSVYFDSKDYHPDRPAEVKLENGIRLYLVQEGDTLSRIAEKFDVSVNTIKWENNLKGDRLRVGQELRILPTTGVLHRVKKGDTLSKIAKLYDVSLEDITIYNDIDATKLKPGMKIIVPNGVKKVFRSSHSRSKKKSSSRVGKSVQRAYYIRPSRGTTTSLFGPRRGSYHYGIDFAQYKGAPIVAAASGKIVKTVSYCRAGNEYCGGGYGNNIVIQHSNGTKTRYAHLSRVLVKTGDYVRQGQEIGKMGNTGHVRPRPTTRHPNNGTHLHFEIIDSRTGRKINPNFLR